LKEQENAEKNAQNEPLAVLPLEKVNANNVVPKAMADKSYLRDFANKLAKFNLPALFTGKCTVENVTRADLSANFEGKWAELQQKYNFDPSLTDFVIGFHGTSEGNIPNIVRSGLLVPGAGNKIGHATDTGWYGKGIYLSPNPALSLGYCRGGGKLLVCAVLMGKRFQCADVIHGAACKPGYDSHVSPDFQEYVLFSAAQVLPIFVINFKGTCQNVPNADHHNFPKNVDHHNFPNPNYFAKKLAKPKSKWF